MARAAARRRADRDLLGEFAARGDRAGAGAAPSRAARRGAVSTTSGAAPSSSSIWLRSIGVTPRNGASRTTQSMVSRRLPVSSRSICGCDVPASSASCCWVSPRRSRASRNLDFAAAAMPIIPQNRNSTIPDLSGTIQIGIYQVCASRTRGASPPRTGRSAPLRSRSAGVVSRCLARHGRFEGDARMVVPQAPSRRDRAHAPGPDRAARARHHGAAPDPGRGGGADPRPGDQPGLTVVIEDAFGLAPRP